MTDAPLRLLHKGLDAIIQHTQQPPDNWLEALLFGHRNDPALPCEPTVQQRLCRYRDACLLFDRDPEAYQARRLRGEQLQHERICRDRDRARKAARTVVPFRRPRRGKAGAA